MANASLKTDFKNGDKLYDYELNNNFRAIQAALAAMNKITWQDDETGVGVSAYKGNTEAIENRALIDGQLLYNTETGETYIDTYVDDALVRINTGSGNVVAIQPSEPENEAVKLWIEEDTLDTLDSEIVNEYSESTRLGYSAAYVNATNTYSTDEIDTGKVWIDGKKIYRKILTFSNSVVSEYITVEAGITNIDTITKMDVLITSDNQTRNVPYIQDVAGTDRVGGCWYNLASNNLILWGGASFIVFDKGIATIEYTKTLS